MLKLTKDKKVTSDSYGIKEILPEDILGVCFSEPVGEIDGWTLKDLMDLIGPRGDIFGEMAWCRFDLFHAEMQKPVVPSEFADNVEYIMIKRNVTMYNGEINEYADVYGGNDTITDAMIDEDIERTGEHNLSNRYAIEFTPVNELANKPIRIDDSFVVRKDIMDDDNMPVIFEAKKPFYLLDIIWALLWEISFAGDPDSRDEQMMDIKAASESVKNGTAKLIPAEEVFERLRASIELVKDVKVDLNERLDPADE